MDGRQMYKLFNELAEIAIEHGGTVFGGYVRDYLKHEYAAKQFYAEKHHLPEMYGNPEISPETRDRLLVASDLDIHFKTRKDVHLFRNELRRRFFSSVVTKIDASYNPEEPGNVVRHMKLEVTPSLSIGRIINSLPGIKTGVARDVLFPELIKCLQGMSITTTTTVTIDILVSQGSNPPFNNLDFECNGLVMNKNGIELCEELKMHLKPSGIHAVLESVIKDIRENRAVLAHFKLPRWQKMASKGWNIIGGNVEKVTKSGEVCTLCLDDVPENDVYKLSCCNASYHRDCLCKIIHTGQTAVANTSKCTHCRQYVYLREDEVTLFSL